MERVIATLLGLTVAEIAALASEGINNGEDPSGTAFDDVTSTLGTVTVVRRRKPSHVGSCSARGHPVNEAMTVPMLVNHLNTPVAPVANNPAPQARDPPPPPDPSSRGALRLHVKSVEKFSGSPIDFEDWELKT